MERENSVSSILIWKAGFGDAGVMEWQRNIVPAESVSFRKSFLLLLPVILLPSADRKGRIT